MASWIRELRSPKLLIGILISAALLALVFSQTELSQAWQRVTQVHGRHLLLPLLLSLIAFPVRALRWQWIFSHQHRPGFWACLRVFVVSNMANVLLPARGGDVLRCFLISREKSLQDASRALATVGVERVFDGLALLIVAAVSLLFLSDTPWLTRLVLAATVVFGGAITAFVLLQRYPDHCRRALRVCLGALRLSRVAAKVDGVFVSFTEGLAAIRSPRRLVLLSVATAVVWLLEAAFIWAMAAAVQLPLSFSDSALVAVVIGLGLMIPAAPGFLGTYEFFSVAVLGLLGATREAALALTLLMHAWVLLVLVVAGLLGLAGSGSGFSRAFSTQLAPRRTLDKEIEVHGV